MHERSYEETRRKRTITFREIKVNDCDETVAGAYKKGVLSKKDLENVYEDMLSIRFFEEMLLEIKENKKYKDTEFFFEGPCHLAIGQEAVAVCEAFYLDENDFIFGSHRSHHEVLAKGFSAIRKMSEEKLGEILHAKENAATYSAVKKAFSSDDVKTEARRFFIFGILSDVFARSTGFCGGVAGSMHVFFPPFGIYPSNAIVGASAPIAAGAALFKKIRKQKGIVIANLGDGAAGRGPVFESLNFASMKQFDTLWEEGYKGALPILFNFSNNYYGMNADTENETMSFSGDVSRIGAFEENGMNAEKIDGWNVAALLDAYKRKTDGLKNGKGPCLLEATTYRLCGHSVNDDQRYRSKKEVEEFRTHDPLTEFPEELKAAGIFTDGELEEIRKRAEEENDRIFALAAAAPFIDFSKDENYLSEKLFNAEDYVPVSDTAPEVLCEKEEISRIKSIREKENYETRDGIFEALADGFYSDPTFIACGEDIRNWNVKTSVYGGFDEVLPRHRFFNVPISEAALVGVGVGYAMCGGKILLEMMYSDFIGCAGDEIINQAAKWQSLSFGRLSLPLILHFPVGFDYGAQHSQDFSGLAASVPGLKVVYPTTAYTAKGLMARALKENNPVLFFESKLLRSKTEPFRKKSEIEKYYEIPIGSPFTVKEGKDVTLLSVGAPLYRALEAAKLLENENVFAEVIDAASLVPFEYEKVVNSVKKTGRILLISDAADRGSFVKELSHEITSRAFEFLKAPPITVSGKDSIIPAYEYRDSYFPTAEKIAKTALEKFKI